MTVPGGADAPDSSPPPRAPRVRRGGSKGGGSKDPPRSAPATEGDGFLLTAAVRFPEGVATVEIDQLIPDPNNSRDHSREQVGQIAAAIREFGFNVPLIIDARNGIMAGHGRHLAAKLLGLSRVPCIRVPYLTAEQRAAFVVADNKLALNSTWNDEKLRAAFASLQGAGFDVGLLAFSDEELQEFELGGEPEQAPQDAEEDNANERTFVKMTFSIHRDQKREIDRAVALARGMNAEADLADIDRPNPSANSNALQLICESFITHHGAGAGKASH